LSLIAISVFKKPWNLRYGSLPAGVILIGPTKLDTVPLVLKIILPNLAEVPTTLTSSVTLPVPTTSKVSAGLSLLIPMRLLPVHY
jgi:hypothetical protein